MSLVAILTDTHIGARKGVKYLQDHFENFYKKLVYLLPHYQRALVAILTPI